MSLYRLLLLPLLLLAAGVASAQPAAAPSIDYRLSIADPASERFQVTATLNAISSDTLTFNFPIWAPGAYDLVYFGRYVDDMKATSAEGRNLKVIRRDSNTFAIVGVTPGTRISYRVRDIETLSNSLWFCLSDIEPDMAFAVGTALFGYPVGYKNVLYTLDVDLPKGWKLAMPLERNPSGHGGRFLARDYDELVDAPLQAGRLQQFDFMAGGKPHHVSVWSPRTLPDSAAAALVDSTRKIVEMVSGFFGEMPYESYTFQFYLVTPMPGEAVFGALEHRNSSTYRWPFSPGRPSATLLSMIAHEYWHLWSPKRIHVAELGPFDYQRPPRTTSLWFAEGLTEYYANLLLMRAGMLAPQELYDELSRAVRGMYGRAQTKSLAEISRGVSELGVYEMMTLYSRGPVVGVLLDAAIRSQTGNRRSLDDAMRAINEEYGKTGRTFGDDEIIPMIERAAGASLAEFNRRYIVGNEPLPFDEYLPAMGLKVADSAEMRHSFGGEFEVIDSIGWKVTSVVPQGTLADLGIAVDDTVTAIEIGGEALPTGRLGRTYITLLAQLQPGATLDVRIDGVRRRLKHGDKNAITFVHEGKSVTKPLRFRQTRGSRRQMIDDPAASAQALEIRRALIGR